MGRLRRAFGCLVCGKVDMRQPQCPCADEVGRAEGVEQPPAVPVPGRDAVIVSVVMEGFMILEGGAAYRGMTDYLLKW